MTALLSSATEDAMDRLMFSPTLRSARRHISHIASVRSYRASSVASSSNSATKSYSRVIALSSSSSSSNPGAKSASSCNTSASITTGAGAGTSSSACTFFAGLKSSSRLGSPQSHPATISSTKANHTANRLAFFSTADLIMPVSTGPDGPPSTVARVRIALAVSSNSCIPSERATLARCTICATLAASAMA